MRYLSVCSGIEAASVAWHPLGWTPVGFSEIEPFPSAVLAHHYPKVTNYGDMSKFRDWSIRSGDIDLLVGGTPCQSFSIAGLRQGLKDPRGNLMLTFLAIAEHLKPKWIVWENVPGVLSSNGGKDFGSFLGGLGELGYGFAYRILDAQWCRTHGHPRAVPQRRRRVFVVGCLGDHIGPAKVLFEQESMLRYSATRGSSRQGTSADVAGCLRSGGEGGIPSSRGEHLVFDESKPIYCGSDISASDTVTSKWQKQSGGPAGSECGLFVLQPVTAILFENHPNDSRITGPHDVAPSCVSRYGTGGGNVPLVIPDVHAVAVVNMQGSKSNACVSTDGSSYTINAMHGHDVHAITVAPIGCFKSGQGAKSRSIGYSETVSPTLPSNAGGNTAPSLVQTMQVRRLTPTECERLQGFPDGWTAIPWKKKDAEDCPDGPRYKALGNSMAVNCMEWLGERIQKFDQSSLCQLP